MSSQPAAATSLAVPAQRLLLEVQHQTEYRYAAPVTLAHHVAHLQPLQDAHQRLMDHELIIHPLPEQAPRSEAVGSGGGAACYFSLVQAHTELQVRASSRVQVHNRFVNLDAAASPAWDPLAASLRFAAGRPYQAVVEHVFPSPFVPRMPALRSYAQPSFPAGRPLAQAALDLMARMHRDFTYETNSTRIDTPLQQVLETRRGVCQDFAHLMIGALRMLGLPARYVSGYLLTHAPDGGAPQLGADATHAWAQLWCPDTPGVPADRQGQHWLDLDPTNNKLPDAGHVRLATGRDFGDVTPLRGVIRGGGQHILAVGVSTQVLQSG